HRGGARIELLRSFLYSDQQELRWWFSTNQSLFAEQKVSLGLSQRLLCLRSFRLRQGIERSEVYPGAGGHAARFPTIAANRFQRKNCARWKAICALPDHADRHRQK